MADEPTRMDLMEQTIDELRNMVAALTTAMQVQASMNVALRANPPPPAEPHTANNLMDNLFAPKGEEINQAPAPPPAKPKAADTTKALEAQMDEVKKSMLQYNKDGEHVLNIDELCIFPRARLPTNFKMLDICKLSGTGNPKTHLMAYTGTLHPMGLSDEILAQLFHYFLSDVALEWFFSLEAAKKKTWEGICRSFTKQYAYNVQIEVTIRDLEATRMDSKETFIDFVICWRAKAVKMTTRPEEVDQVRMFIKNLQLVYAKHLVTQYIPTFKHLH